MSKSPNQDTWEMPRAILPKKKLSESAEKALKLLEELAKLRIN